MAEREGHRLELRVNPQLAHDVLDVRAQRVRRDEQLLADLRGGAALAERLEDLELTGCQRLDLPTFDAAVAGGRDALGDAHDD